MEINGERRRVMRFPFDSFYLLKNWIFDCDFNEGVCLNEL